ncbi:alpha/beta hydrolase [Streptacidiphilus sp. MAP5-3]|uniref:alpha/beta hydrolase n=1 Tax=unclassified Streptacidiphilus TaxID=2643834 RepID=UPI003511D0DA
MDAVAKSAVRIPDTSGRRTHWRSSAEARLTAADGVSIHAAYLPPQNADATVAVVLAHGFGGAVERPAVRRAARVFAGSAGVITFSFRGHGRSDGLSTVGDREVLDLDATVAWARALGFETVVTVGFSMGGAVALRHAALHGGVAAVAAVSAPARWYYQGTAPMRRLHWVVMKPLGRVVGRIGLKTRIDPNEWVDVPIPPVDAAARVNVPLLVVHGDADPYFPLDHPRSLREAAPDSELWIEPGFGHAENAATEALLERVSAWLTSHA